jgi:hypothetical protein
MTAHDRPSVTTLVVWGLWAALTVAGLAFVGEYGRDCPYMDDWLMHPALAGDVDAARWAWEPHGEHRWWLPRFLYVELYQAVGDLRAAMVLNVLGSAAAAAVLIRAAGRVRGRTAAADAFFPLVFLHFGHWENWLWSSQLCMILATLLATGLVAAAGVGLRSGWAVAAVVAVALLPLCGAPGQMYGACGAAWLGGASVAALRRGEWLRAAALACGPAVAAVVLSAVAAAHPNTPFAGLPRTPAGLAGFAVRLTGMAFGPAAETLWPVLAVGLVGVSASAALRLVRRDLSGTAGLIAVALAAGAVGAGMTWGRAWAGPAAAFSSRYAVLMAVAAAVAYLACVRVGGPRLATTGPAVLAALSALAWPLNARVGLDRGGLLAGQIDALAADVRDGWPADVIGERYDWQLFLKHPLIERDLDAAARIGFAPFRDAPPRRTFAYTPLAIAAPTPRLELPAKTGVVAVRVHGGFSPPDCRMADVRVRWQAAADGAWWEERFLVPMNGPRTLVVRICERPTVIEVTADPPGYRITAAEIVEGAASAW